MNQQLRYLKRDQLDVLKWDARIRKSGGLSLYGYCFCLDQLSPGWLALVLGDYEAVMPVSCKRKFGIRYMFTPAFIQRSDIFGAEISDEVRVLFLNKLAESFKYIDIDLGFEPAITRGSKIVRMNYIKQITGSLSVIRDSYTPECHRNLSKAIARDCEYTDTVSVAKVVELYRAAYGRKASYRSTDYERLVSFAQAAAERGCLVNCGVKNKKSGQLLFGALLFMADGRLYYVLGAPSAEGRSARAGYFLIDALLERFLGVANIFDFEGSDIPSVADFYKRFSPGIETYYHWHYNHLPVFLKIFRK